MRVPRFSMTTYADKLLKHGYLPSVGVRRPTLVYLSS